MNEPVACVNCGKVDETEFGLCPTCEQRFAEHPARVGKPVRLGRLSKDQNPLYHYLHSSAMEIGDLLVYNAMAQFLVNRQKLDNTLTRMSNGGSPLPTEHCEVCYCSMLETPVCSHDLGGHVWSAFVTVENVDRHDILYMLDGVSVSTRYLNDGQWDNTYRLLLRHFNADEYRARFPALKYEPGSMYPTRSLTAHFYTYWKPS